VSRESFLPYFAAESLQIINNAVITTVLHNLIYSRQYLEGKPVMVSLPALHY
jgi:hypothetical protein